MKKITNWFRSLFCRRGFINLAIIKQFESNGIKPLFHSNKTKQKGKVFKVKRFKIVNGVK
jgi:hypothetical protein